jgi:glycosyltransferase involved in cell wall biosynthesis
MPSKANVRILFLVYLPPPTHGASVSGKMTFDYYKSDNRSIFINISLSRSVEEIGRFNLKKLYYLLSIIAEISYSCMRYQIYSVYFSHTIRKGGFYRDLLIIFLLKFFGLKIVYHIHNDSRRFDTMNSTFFNFLYRKSEFIWLSEKLVIDQFRNKFTNYILPNVSSLGEVHFNPRVEVKNIVCVANLYIFKGVHLLSKVIEVLDGLGYYFNFFFIGSEGDILVKDIITINQRLKGCKIEVVESADRSTMSKYLGIMDLMVLPSADEAMPLSLIEGLNFGLPLICCDVGAISDIVEQGRNGYLVNRDVNSFVDAIIFMYERPEIVSKCSVQSYEIYREKYNKELYFENLNRIMKL